MTTERGSLPSPGTPLIARERELCELRDALQSGHRLITLTGPGGTGKSRLSIALATEVAARFGGGAWFVDLTGLRDAHLVLSTIARTLGVQESGSAALSATLEVALRPQPTLLVLDNFEHLMDAAESVASLLLACPTLVVIVSSREALAVRAEKVFPVSTLGVPDLTTHTDLESVAPAVALFVERAAARRRGFALTAQNYPAVAAICARLDGLPLAIELAAAQIALLSPETVLRRLADRAPHLVRGPRDLPARHQSLDAAVAWSYELLTPDQQAAFRWCGVFVGGSTIDAFIRACPSDNAAESLVQLATKSLLQIVDDGTDAPRWRMLETIRTYAAELLRMHGEWAAARARCADYYVELAEGLRADLHSHGLTNAVASLAREYDNLWDVLEWAAGTGHLELGLRMAAGLYRFWLLRGILAEPRQWLDAALARADPVAPEIRAAALNAAGVLAGMQHDDVRAAALFEESLGIWTTLGDVGQMARATCNLGLLAHNRHETEHALELFRRGEALYAAAGYGWGLASVLGSQARVAMEQGEQAEALRLFERSLATFRELGDQWGIGISLADLGRLRLDLGDTAQAMASFRESMQLFQAVGNVVGITEVLEGVAAVIVGRQPRRAAELLGAADALRRSTAAVQPRVEQGLVAQTLGRVTARLSEPVFADAWARGQAMPMQAAIDFALSIEYAAADPAVAGDGSPVRLSPRELEVAQLIALGRSNREIAEALVLSNKTVESHIKHIFDKLGVQGRTEVAVWATHQGLALSAQSQ
ncbi:MAG TPA: LuxR C-terminal-related transcriptional regulator [Chloroflexota bacterium]|nr:LuxR C-terminal-related transcriptional regulator [Chloroflexota bacterium]